MRYTSSPQPTILTRAHVWMARKKEEYKARKEGRHVDAFSSFLIAESIEHDLMRIYGISIEMTCVKDGNKIGYGESECCNADVWRCNLTDGRGIIGYKSSDHSSFD